MGYIQMDWSKLTTEELSQFLELNNVTPEGDVVSQVNELWHHLTETGQQIMVTVPVHDLLLAMNFPGTATEKYNLKDIEAADAATISQFAEVLGIPTDEDGLMSRVVRILRILGLLNEYNPVDLDKEYARFGFAENMLQVIRQGLTTKLAYEAKNILERWLIGLSNIPATSDPIFSPEKLKIQLPATQKMLSELKEKHISNPETRVDSILKLAQNYCNVKHYPKAPEVIFNNNNLSIGTFTKDFTPERSNILVSRSRKFIEANGLNVDEKTLIGSMALRYGALMPGGQQWAIPLPIYKYLTERYGVTIEGFASPINSQIIRLPNNDNFRFCSLFLDTDEPFGSIGSFFDQDFTNRNVFANPPYVPALMDRVAERIIEICEQMAKTGNSVRFFITLPEWIDADFYIKLATTRFKVFERTLCNGQHYYENGDEKIPARFNTQIFVCAVNVNDTYIDLVRTYNTVFKQ